jgi:hypothetical protein
MSDSISEFRLESAVLQVWQNLHFWSSVIGLVSISGYALHASGLWWYILQVNPPCGDRDSDSVSKKGQVLPF